MGERGYHEPYEVLSPETRSIHRGIVSLIEELEAVDWYRQRIDGAKGEDDLQSVLTHNMNEELEHAAMTLEWLRRRVPHLAEMLRRYLFTEGPIVDSHHEGPGSSGEAAGSLGITAELLREERS